MGAAVHPSFFLTEHCSENIPGVNPTIIFSRKTFNEKLGISFGGVEDFSWNVSGVFGK